jgi:hypothetical protein
MHLVSFETKSPRGFARAALRYKVIKLARALESKQVQERAPAQPAGWPEGKDERSEHRIGECR